jgi:hypothetical protein
VKVFQATPGNYTNRHAAHLACLAFAEEEQNEWLVVKKTIQADTEVNFYRPCRKDDLVSAIEDQWYPLTTVVQSIQGVEKEPIDITSFAPMDVAGFDLACHKTKDGRFRFRDHIVGELPKEVKCNNIVYTLEDVKEFEKDEDKGETFCNALYA